MPKAVADGEVSRGQPPVLSPLTAQEGGPPQTRGPQLGLQQDQRHRGPGASDPSSVLPLRRARPAPTSPHSRGRKHLHKILIGLHKPGVVGKDVEAFACKLGSFSASLTLSCPGVSGTSLDSPRSWQGPRVGSGSPGSWELGLPRISSWRSSWAARGLSPHEFPRGPSAGPPPRGPCQMEPDLRGRTGSSRGFPARPWHHAI